MTAREPSRDRDATKLDSSYASAASRPRAWANSAPATAVRIRAFMYGGTGAHAGCPFARFHSVISCATWRRYPLLARFNSNGVPSAVAAAMTSSPAPSARSRASMRAASGRRPSPKEIHQLLRAG